MCKLTQHDVEEMRDGDGNVHICMPPPLNQVFDMKLKKLLCYLRCCPLSEFFGASWARLSNSVPDKRLAQQKVIELICNNPVPSTLEEVSECENESGSEASSYRGRNKLVKGVAFNFRVEHPTDFTVQKAAPNQQFKNHENKMEDGALLIKDEIIEEVKGTDQQLNANDNLL